ncbi:TetR/AcrR family transcriptional regulator [Micromonospora phytophila]|uniref:TetR/AcrR family transcriptional regulator n=1 Tax=Micromonospora phytophila TaxID=709888 RepID=UPI0020302B4C|nr:TetR/AcrR family transcriptional regulator [Micromonospora phytophila]MCM0678097.1 TetR/AcrR family transcriptional regulator [Micromonospora phytophila]
MTSFPARNRRADARRSRAAILDAAVQLLNARPDASVEAIATAAGVTRQTVYAHFPSREHLLGAVLDRVTEEAVAAMDAADPDAGPAAVALLRVLDASSRAAGRHRVLLQKIGSLPVSPEQDRDRHAPVVDRLRRVIRRGQETGEFDGGLALDWLVAVTIRLGHAAGEEVDAGRMSERDAATALHTSLLRVLGAGRAAASPDQPAAESGSTSPVGSATAKTTRLSR